MKINDKQLTRITVIDHSECTRCNGTGFVSPVAANKQLQCPICKGSKVPGRVMEAWGVSVELEVQDDGKTLKIVIKDNKVEPK